MIGSRNGGHLHSPAARNLALQKAAMIVTSIDRRSVSYLKWTFPILVILLAAILRCLSFLHDDVSWFITMAEKTLSGETPYVDVIDVNPPAAFLLYMPQVLIAHALTIAPEAIVNVSVFFSVFASLLESGRIVLRSHLINSTASAPIATLALFIFLVLCGDVFAQREHFAVVALLPLLAVYAARVGQRSPDLRACILAGIGGGIALAIKVYFVLPVLLPLLYVVWLRRDKLSNVVAVLVAPENLTLALFVAAYSIAVVALFPAYVERTVPMALAIYVPIRESIGEMAIKTSTWAVLTAAVVALGIARGEIRKPILAICALAGAGFAIAYFIQSKGWPYHAYPAFALLVLTGGIAWIENVLPSLRTMPVRRARAIKITAILISLILFAVDLAWVKLPLSYPRYFQSVATLGPPHPKVIAIADTLAGPQLTRLIGGNWVGRVPNQFMSMNARRILNTTHYDATGRKQLEDYAAFDRAILVESIRTRRPDVILIESAGLKRWALSDPAIAQALRSYREAAVINDVGIWLSINARSHPRNSHSLAERTAGRNASALQVEGGTSHGSARSAN
jgi:hypothetical protein